MKHPFFKNHGPLKINDINISSSTKCFIRKLIHETPDKLNKSNYININIIGNSGTGKLRHLLELVRDSYQ